ncbi:amino acid transporter AVT6A-like [Vicia villosa]|uniref:amino acid transporter AVT6A-like n=1 Tax=Vicia villosa TaxID=3911 RepID=UPI00273BD9A5|nr:amino acid transporter AVT6A-like [Vicia villosa]XP_058778851.1 amino acid transporter AVT6A-like [Vicia villosa]
MTIGSDRRNKAIVEENAPLLPKTQESDVGLDEFNGASFSSAVFNLSTTIVGAGIMSLPACVKKLGIVPGLIAIILSSLFTEKSVDFMIRFSRAGNISSYGSLMGDSFGKYGRALVQICITVNNIGVLIVYMIIIGDIISGTSSSGVHHFGILEGWFGVHWCTGRTFVLLFTTLVIIVPLTSFKRIDSLRYTSALSVGLAGVYLVIVVGISIFKIISGGMVIPRLFPIITDASSVFELFTTFPVLISAYICHTVVHSINNELKDSKQMRGVVKTSFVLCCLVYLFTSFFGFFLFGEETLDDVLANFDTDLDIPFGFILNDIVRVSYAVHIVLIIPVLFYAVRINFDGLLFSSSSTRSLNVDNFRFFSITFSLVGIIFLGANFIPSIWDIFQFIGATTAICIAFIFPVAITLRDKHNIATKTDKTLSIFMIVISVTSSAVAIYSNVYALINKK